MFLILTAAAVGIVPPLTVSKETTYITEPLRPDGVPDYVGFFNLPLKKIDPSDNAAVLIVRAAGPAWFSRETAPEYFRLLQCEPPPKKGDDLTELGTLKKRKGLEDDADRPTPPPELRPWRTADDPLSAELLAVNEAPLRLIVEASRKKILAAPLVCRNDPPLLLTAPLEILTPLRTAHSLLLLRAMRSAAEGNFDAAYEDVDAVHRLAALVGRPARSTIEGIAANAFRRSALRAEQTLAFVPGRSAAELRRRAAVTAGLPPPTDLVESFDQWERLDMLNVVAYSMVYGAQILGNQETPKRTYSVVAIDEALRTVNSWYDRFAKALRRKPSDPGPTYADLEDELNQRHKKRREREKTFFLFRESPPKHPRGPEAAVGEAYAETMLVVSLPTANTFFASSLRNTATQRQTILAYTLAAYKLERGKYPQKLDAAELHVAPETIIDPFSNKPFRYELKDGKRRIVGVEPHNTGRIKIIVAGKPQDAPLEHTLELP